MKSLKNLSDLRFVSALSAIFLAFFASGCGQESAPGSAAPPSPSLITPYVAGSDRCTSEFVDLVNGINAEGRNQPDQWPQDRYERFEARVRAFQGQFHDVRCCVDSHLPNEARVHLDYIDVNQMSDRLITSIHNDRGRVGNRAVHDGASRLSS